MTKASKGLCATVTPSDKPGRKLAMQNGRCKGFLSPTESLVNWIEKVTCRDDQRLANSGMKLSYAPTTGPFEQTTL